MVSLPSGFGFNIGGSASRTKGTFNTTRTPLVPAWATDLTRGVAARVGDVLGHEPRNLIAPAHPLQDQAAAGAAGLNGTPWNYEAALDLTRGAANTSWLGSQMSAATPFASGGKAYNFVDHYMSPYLREVVDSSAADFDAHAGQVRAQQALDLAASGAFGGSGAALTQSMTEGELARGRASVLSGLRAHAYDTALGAAAGDADRATQARIANAQLALQDRAQKVGFGFQAQQQQMQAADKLANLSAARDANQRANVEAQAEIGETMRGVDQQQRQAPITHVQQLVAMLSGLPISLFVGENERGTKSEKTRSGSFGFSYGT